MTEHTALIYQLLEEQRNIQNRNAEVLADVRAQVGAVQQLGVVQSQSMAELRTDIRSINDRLLETERLVGRLPSAEEAMRQLGERISAVSGTNDRRHQETDSRLRLLEGDNRETGVFRRGASGLIGIIARWVLPFVAGVIGTAVLSGRIG